MTKCRGLIALAAHRKSLTEMGVLCAQERDPSHRALSFTSQFQMHDKPRYSSVNSVYYSSISSRIPQLMDVVPAHFSQPRSFALRGGCPSKTLLRVQSRVCYTGGVHSASFPILRDGLFISYVFPQESVTTRGVSSDTYKKRNSGFMGRCKVHTLES